MVVLLKRLSVTQDFLASKFPKAAQMGDAVRTDVHRVRSALKDLGIPSDSRQYALPPVRPSQDFFVEVFCLVRIQIVQYLVIQIDFKKGSSCVHSARVPRTLQNENRMCWVQVALTESDFEYLLPFCNSSPHAVPRSPLLVETLCFSCMHTSVAQAPKRRPYPPQTNWNPRLRP